MCFDTTRIHKAGTHPGYVTADKAFPGLGQSLLVSHGRPYPVIPVPPSPKVGAVGMQESSKQEPVTLKLTGSFETKIREDAMC